MTGLVFRAATTVEASTIGLAPGEWPECVTYEGWEWSRGAAVYQGGPVEPEIAYVEYWCRGRKLTVLND